MVNIGLHLSVHTTAIKLILCIFGVVYTDDQTTDIIYKQHMITHCNELSACRTITLIVKMQLKTISQFSRAPH